MPIEEGDNDKYNNNIVHEDDSEYEQRGGTSSLQASAKRERSQSPSKERDEPAAKRPRVEECLCASSITSLFLFSIFDSR